MRKFGLLFFLVVSFATISISQNVIRVSPYGSPFSNGSPTWFDATTIENALDIVSNTQLAGDPPQEIWLEEGTYYINQQLEIIGSSFTLYNLSLLGGFNGTETSESQRDPNVNIVIFKGGGNNTILRNFGWNTAIDGITFEDGHAIALSFGGGALQFSGDGGRISNCTFRNNTSEAMEGGGAIRYSASTSIIENCRFENNLELSTANNSLGGGAISNLGFENTIENCTFINNHSNSGGGAISAENNVYIKNSTFENNTTDKSGGAVHIEDGQLAIDFSTISNCEFLGNDAVENGGAIDLNSFYTTKLWNNLFDQNNAIKGGGAIYLDKKVQITNCDFVNNLNTAVMYEFAEAGDELSIFNSIFYNNTPFPSKNRDLDFDIFSISTNLNFENNIFEDFNQGTNNLVGVDPEFRSPKDYQLTCTSPALDYGINASFNSVSGLNATSTVDLAGDNRVFNSVIDLGVYEFSESFTCPQLITPLDGAINVNVLTTIEWNQVSGATGYILKIGTTPGGTDLWDQDMGLTYQYTPSTPFPSLTTIYVKIIPYDNQCSLTTCPDFSFTTDVCRNLTDCTQLSLPVDGATGVLETTSLEWTPVTNAQSYKLRIGTSPGGSDILDADVGLTTTFTPATPFDFGTTYYVQVIPIYLDCPTDSCTETTFTTRECLNIAGCPNLTKPTNGQTGVFVDTDLTWTSATDATKYQVIVGTSSGANDVADDFVTNGTSYSFANDLDYSTTYYVQIISYYGDCPTVICTEYTFTTRDCLNIAGCPNLTKPTNGQTGVVVETDLTWTRATDATSYTVIVGTSPGADDVVNEPVGDVTSYNFLNDLDYSTTYYVQIIPYFDACPTETCTEYSFTTRDCLNIVDCTNMTQPMNGQTEVSVLTDIRWDPVTDATKYQLIVGTSPGANDVLDTDVVNATIYTFSAPLDYLTTYYVQIIPYYDDCPTVTCDEYSFTTQPCLNIVDCTQLSLPADGATGVPITTSLEWDAVPNATSYDIYISKTPGARDFLTLTGLTGTSYSFPYQLDYFTTFYVEIVPYFNACATVICTETSFTTRECLNIVGCTELSQPIDGSTDVSIGTDLTWDAVPDAGSYGIQIGTSPGANDVLDLNLGNVTNYSFPSPLNYSTDYYVRIIPYFDACPTVTCMETKFRTEDKPLPSCNQILYPLDGEIDVSTNLNFSWAPTAYAEGYLFKLGTTPGGEDVYSVDAGLDNTLSLPFKLDCYKDYYISIIPYNVSGTAGKCTSFQFKTTSVGSDCVCFFDEIIEQEFCVGEDQVYPDGEKIPNEPGVYNYEYIEVDPDGCDTRYLITTKVNAPLFPNAYSPNGDGVNDEFYMLNTGCPVKNFNLKIYNRWGEKVFESNSVTEKWTEVESVGKVYLWYATYTVNEIPIEQKGTVVVLE